MRPAIQNFKDVNTSKMIDELQEIIFLIQENMGLFSQKEREFVVRINQRLTEGQCSDKQASYILKMRNVIMFGRKENQKVVPSIEEEIQETLNFIRSQFKSKRERFKDSDLLFLKSLQNGEIKEQRTVHHLYEIKNRLL